MKYACLTDAGLTRSENQDYVYVTDKPIGLLPNLFLVADGMGGHNAGAYASSQAVNIVLDEVRNSYQTEPVAILEQAITEANRILYSEAHSDSAKAGMGTTFVAATIMDNKMLVANVGDSRLYIVDDSSLCQITRDHSLVQELLRAGKMANFDPKRHPKRNAITRAVGAEERVRVDFFEVDRNNFRQVLICTDGLTNMVDDNKIHDILLVKPDCDSRVRELVALANKNGGHDNITALVIDNCNEEIDNGTN